jgi:hypothetical protein
MFINPPYPQNEESPKMRGGTGPGAGAEAQKRSHRRFVGLKALVGGLSVALIMATASPATFSEFSDSTSIHIQIQVQTSPSAAITNGP